MNISPLVKRCCTALVLIPLVIIGIFTLSPLAFGIAVSLIMLLAAWEWTRLMSLEKISSRLLYLVLLIALIVISKYISYIIHLSFLFKTILFFAVVWWLLALVWIILYVYKPDLIKREQVNVLLNGFVGILVLFPFVLSLYFLRISNHGIWLILYLLLLIWCVDSAAYATGRLWGRQKLLPAVSPGKTWWGFYGGLGAGIIIAVLAGWLFNLSAYHFLLWLIGSILTMLVSVVGDLFVSMMKRQCNLKDSGSLLPGHGGVLDRLDSLLAAAPIFAYSVLLSISYA
jgi:phosphatidate cytidylyltransferase